MNTPPLLAVGLALGLGCSAGPPELPQVQNAGGPILKNATLVAVTFGTDPLEPTARAFLQSLPGSSYWSLLTEYGVGAPSAAAPIHSTLALKGSMDETDWQATLPGELEKELDGFARPAEGELLVLFLPPGVQSTNQGLAGCTDFGGYHSAVKLSDGTPVAYAVVPRCTAFNGLTLPDSLTGVASHEILEAVVDPYAFLGTPAFSDVDAESYAFTLAFGGGEIADLCLNTVPSFYTPSDVPYVVQRIWSNAAARLRHDPCVPASDAGPFIQAIPQLGTQTFSVNGASAGVRSIAIGVGQTATVDLELLSDPGDAGPFGVSLFNVGNGAVGWTLTPTTGSNGQHLRLALTVQAAGSQTGISGKSEILAVMSQAPSRVELWPILITNP